MKGTISEMARAHTADALRVLVQVALKGESEAARVSAANALLDRGYGKPTTPVEHSGPDGGPISVAHLNDAQLTALAAIGGDA